MSDSDTVAGVKLQTMLERLGLAADDPLAQRLAAAQSDAPPDWIHLAAAVARSLAPVALAPAAAAMPWPGWGGERTPLVIGVRSPPQLTRGVPGTHDVAALAGVIEDLGREGTVSLPGFDKGTDDPLPRERWRTVRAPVDVLVLEGWCVGARPQDDAALAEPVNELERVEDRDGRWRRFVNEALAGAYAALWSRLDGLLFIEVPDLDAVRRWRGQQEQALPAGRRMDAAAIERFVAHYERLTRAMRADLPSRASLHVRLDEDHRIADLRCRAYSESIQR